MNTKETPASLTVLLGLLIALPALGTDLFAPSLAGARHSLSVSVSAGQSALTTYFAGLAAGMLVWGPLSDRFGRRPVLLAGLATMFAAIGRRARCMESIGGVAVARLAQGFAHVERRGDRALA